jgi:phosphotransferase system HPr (HPr) family protein
MAEAKSEVTLTVRHEEGLHARPAALFVKTAKCFDCDIGVSCNETEANAKSMLSVLTLGAGQGAVVTVRAEGEDAEEALEALKNLIACNFEVEE